MAIEAGSSVYWQAKRGTVQSGLVGHWDSMAMSSRTGNIVYDLAGNNNGTLTNGATFERIGMGFDGSNDYVNTTLTFPISLDKSGTLSAWAFTSITNGIQPILSLGGQSTGFIIIVFRNPGYGLHAWFELWDLTNNPSIFSPINANQWYHIVGVFGQDTMRLYVNAQQVASLNNATTQATTIPSQTILRLGNTNQYNYWLTGITDDCRIYNRALSQSEITQNFNATRYRFGV